VADCGLACAIEAAVHAADVGFVHVQRRRGRVPMQRVVYGEKLIFDVNVNVNISLNAKGIDNN